MATLNEIIYNIKNLKGGGIETDDSELTRRQLEFIINHFRAEIIGQRAVQRKSLEGFYQEIENIKLESTRDFKALRNDVVVLKSKKQLPGLVTSNSGGYIIQHVGYRDDFYGFQKTYQNVFNLDLENPYIQNVYFIVNNYLYIATKTDSNLKEVFVRTVAENPRELLDFVEVDLMRGYDWNYPIPNDQIGQLNSLIVNNEYKWMNMLPSDLLNNGKEDKLQG